MIGERQNWRPIMDLQRLRRRLQELKQPSYRLQQAARSYYQDLGQTWDSLSTWPKDLRAACADLAWSPLELTDTKESREPESIKFAFKTQDAHYVETVFMRHDDGRNTVCVSSQIGCAMGCAFCATGALGIKRNLTAEEIVDQIIQAARYVKAKNGKITNIVFMGMGEPFNNTDEVFAAIKILTSPEEFGLGARHISISTCGIVPGIERLAKELPQINLAISLHAPNQEVRAKIMPVSRAYPLDRLMRALRAYMDWTHRKVMFEYIMLDGLNDSPEDAQDLADLFQEHRHLAHVNLIKYHDTEEARSSDLKLSHLTLRPTNDDRIKAFQNVLKRRGISVTRRVSFGEEIDAACGQLAGKLTTKD